MKKYSLLSALFLLLLTASSFGLPGVMPKKEKKKAPVTARRCGPIITVTKQSSAIVTNIQLVYVPTGYTYSVSNPTFPYAFPQSGNGDYVIKIWFSSVPAQGAYVGANDLCAPAVNKYAQLAFTAAACEMPFYVNITNYQCL